MGLCLLALYTLLPVSEGLAQDSTVGLTRIIGGLSSPVAIAHAGDDSGRLFIVEQNGRVRVSHGGVLLDTAFLDITDRVLFQGERGAVGTRVSTGLRLEELLLCLLHELLRGQRAGPLFRHGRQS